MLFNPKPTTNYSQPALSALAQLRLKIQGNIEEQPMDVKGLITPPKTQSFNQVFDWYYKATCFMKIRQIPSTKDQISNKSQ